MEAIFLNRKQKAYRFLMILALYIPCQVLLILIIRNNVVMSLSLIPILVAGWLLGWKYTVIMGTTVFGITTLILLIALGGPEVSRIMPLGAVMVTIYTLIGAMVGWTGEMKQRLNAELAERKKNENLRASKNAAEAANQAKNDFLVNMSHELRTPLNSIIGFSQMLQHRYFGDLNEKQTGYVIDILESGKHLLSLINDMLDISKIEAGKERLKLSDFLLEQVVESGINSFRDACINRRIDLKFERSAEVRKIEINGDERKIKQVILNLLSNAVKFTPDQGTIELTSWVEGENVFLRVRDSGVGIQKEDQKHIFEKFYQAGDGLTNRTKGTGLGLPICKSLINLHNGDIFVESEGKGCTFTFSLPIKR